MLPDISVAEIQRRSNLYSERIRASLPICSERMMNSDAYFHEVEGAEGHGVAFSGLELRLKSEKEMISLLDARISDLKKRLLLIAEAQQIEALIQQDREQRINAMLSRQQTSTT